jgi:hypothetical protein
MALENYNHEWITCFYKGFKWIVIPWWWKGSRDRSFPFGYVKKIPQQNQSITNNNNINQNIKIIVSYDEVTHPNIKFTSISKSNETIF